MILINKSRENINFKKQSLMIRSKAFHKNFKYESNLHISVNFKTYFKLYFPR